MKKMLKRLLIAASAAAVLLCGCTRNAAEVNIPVSDISSKLIDELTWVDSLRQIDDSVIDKFYGFDTSKLEAYEVYVSDSGSTAEEIAVVKMSDSSVKSDVTAAMEKRVEKQKKQFENYMPEEMFKLENALISEQGNYVILVVADEFEQAEEILADCFSGK